MAYDKVLWYSSPVVRRCYREGVHHTPNVHMYCTVKDLNTHHMLYNSVSLNMCMSFAKCAVKWIVVITILCPIPLPYKMAEVRTCSGF